MFDWFKRIFGTPATSLPSRPHEERTSHAPRWYFFSIGQAMGSEVFRVLCQDEEFGIVSGWSRLVDGKLKVRWYLTSPTIFSENLSRKFFGNKLVA